jgi:hypothetical protein
MLEGCDGLLEVIALVVLVLAPSLILRVKTYRLGLELRVYSYKPTGLPTLVWAYVVDKEIWYC